VVNERLIAGLGEGKRAGTAHAARGASDKGGLTCESGHDLASVLIVSDAWRWRAVWGSQTRMRRRVAR
jgi:hypothetical protein